jgi:plastocyanin
VVVPRILFAVPLLAAAVVLPAVGADPAKPPPGALGMLHEAFAAKVITVRCGQSVTMVNDSRWVHIIGPGQDGTLTAAPKGVPVITRRLMQTNDVYKTGPWTRPGTYYLTCSVHPEMTVKVVVTGTGAESASGSCCCSHGA